MYTPAQQKRIDDANAQLAEAKSRLDSAISDGNSKLADLNRCNCGKGKNLMGACTPLKTKYEFPNLANVGDCIETPFPNDCKTDCCKRDTCKDRVTTYNDSISVYNSAKSNYDTAKSNLDTVLTAIGQEIKTDPNQQQAITEIEANAKAVKAKWIFFGLCVLVVLAGGIYFGVKTGIKKGYLIGGGLGIILVLYVVFFGIKQK